MPARHTAPAGHGPLQLAVMRPGTLPYRPGLHKPLQLAVGRPVVDPNCPMVQLVHVPAPVKLNLPTGQTAAVALVDPATHAYPAVQFAVQVALGMATVSP